MADDKIRQRAEQELEEARSAIRSASGEGHAFQQGRIWAALRILTPPGPGSEGE